MQQRRSAKTLIKINRSDIVYERLYTPYAYVTFNGLSYGLPKNTNFSFGARASQPRAVCHLLESVLVKTADASQDTEYDIVLMSFV